VKTTVLILAIGFITLGCSSERQPSGHHDRPPAEFINVSLDSLKQIAKERVERVKDDPQGRYQLRKEFYHKFGHGKFSQFGFGNSELAFMKWETRGVLHPPDYNPPGSPWWREVNLDFIYWSELAGLIYLSDVQLSDTDELPKQVWNWLHFLEEASAKNWYKAHNSGIIAAYHKYADLAMEEIHPEQVFINMVLYRLLYAQAMVEAEHFAFGKLGEFLADPRGFAVDFIIHDPFFYPAEYPLTIEEQEIILGKKHSIGELIVEFFDDILVLPHIDELYETASIINGTPELLGFISNGEPVYPFIR